MRAKIRTKRLPIKLRAKVTVPRKRLQKKWPRKPPSLRQRLKRALLRRSWKLLPKKPRLPLRSLRLMPPLLNKLQLLLLALPLLPPLLLLPLPMLLPRQPKLSSKQRKMLKRRLKSWLRMPRQKLRPQQLKLRRSPRRLPVMPRRLLRRHLMTARRLETKLQPMPQVLRLLPPLLLHQQSDLWYLEFDSYSYKS